MSQHRMSPRRLALHGLLTPRRARRGRSLGAAGTGQRLVLSSPPPSTLQHAIAGGGATVQLQTATGQPIRLAGVVVRVSLPLGSAATLVTSPASATTDATGSATFTALTLSGVADAYDLVFAAAGYLSAVASGIALIAGAAVASASTATVPSGRIGQTTVIDIQLRDGAGNPLSGPGTSAVTVQIAGVNPVPQTTVNFNSVSGYRFTYAPSVAGTDTLTIKYGGVPIGGSPYPSVVAGATGGFTATSLRASCNGNIIPTLLGTGPYGTGGVFTAQEPIFRAAQGTRDPAALVAAIAEADAKDILLLPTMPGPRQTWTDLSGTCRIYNDGLFRAGVDTYRSTADGGTLAPADFTALVGALRRRRIVWYMFDEPWIDEFCDSVTPYVVRQAFRYVKSVFPDSLTVARMEPQYMRGNAGWIGHTLMPDGRFADQLPVNYFDKLDYAWATYRGSTRSPSKGMTPRQWYTYAEDLNTANGYGTVPSHNWVNLGDGTDCWDAFAVGDGRRDARIHGDNSTTGQIGLVEACSVASADTYWMESPDRIREVFVAAIEHPDFPFMSCYQHSLGGVVHTPFVALQQRADVRQGWVDAIRTGESRATAFRWRVPK